MAANGARNQIGYALQLGTVRFLGTFLSDPTDAPAVVVDYVAEQLGLDPADLKGYGEKEARWDHQKLIRQAHGYTSFEFEQWFGLARWVYRRVWSGSERPIVLFDLVTHRLVEAKILLPGVTTLERMIAGLRERAALRQYRLLAAAPSPGQRRALEELVVVEEGRRVSKLDRLRRSPTDVSGGGVAKAVDRHLDLRALGATTWDLSAIPPGRIAALTRFADAARAQAVDALAGDRKLATLVAFAQVMEPTSADEAIEVFDLIPGTPKDWYYILEGLLEQETSLKPTEIASDTSGASEIAFGIFRLLGWQFSPRLADVGSATLFRADPAAHYGRLESLIRSRVNLGLIRDN